MHREITLKEAQLGLRNKSISSHSLAEHFLKQIKEKDKDIHAFLEVFDDVLEQADKADKIIRDGKGNVLTGIPIALKDNILIKGKRASAASKILENYISSYTSTAMQKLIDQGAVILGRTNMDEFAMGSSTENSAFGTTKNPYDKNRVSGGSSGGSAAAVASGQALLSFGSDTGGSIRQPASFCGCVGLKPTYGAVSRYGLIALGSSLDQIGPFGKTVEDVETAFNVIRGFDKMDSTSISDEKYLKLEESKKKYIVGVPRDFLSTGVDENVLSRFEETLGKLSKNGCEIKDIALPNIKYSLPAYYIIMPAEASANLSRFDGMRYGLHKDGADVTGDFIKSRAAGFGPEVRRRILLGTYVLSAGYYDAFYGKAGEVRSLINDDFKSAFKEVDAIVTPTSPTPAFKIGEKSDPLSMYLADIFTVPANITGMPGISIPCGTVENEGKELPVGFQILAPHMREDRLFVLGKKIEK